MMNIIQKIYLLLEEKQSLTDELCTNKDYFNKKHITIARRIKWVRAVYKKCAALDVSFVAKQRNGSEHAIIGNYPAAFLRAA